MSAWKRLPVCEGDTTVPDLCVSPFQLLLLRSPRTEFLTALFIMDWIQSKLTPEMLLMVFAYLSSCQRDILACRAVSRCFRVLSAEFVVRRVVFAKRLDAMFHLWKVLQDKDLSQHVTELVYDASAHNEDLATDFDEYETACARYCTRPLHDAENIRRSRIYAQFFRQVCANRPWRGIIKDEKARHVKGLHKGFQSYYRRWLEESQMIEDGVDSDLLAQALSRLPKLRRIVFTDFRELAGEGEGYKDVCERIFGNALEPRGLSFSSETYKESTLLLDIIAESPEANITSLSIGGHPYESFEEFWRSRKTDRGLLHRPYDPPALPCDPPWDEDDTAARRVCKTLQHLRLPIEFAHELVPYISPLMDDSVKDSFVGRILGSAARTLVRLSLHALDLLTCNDGDVACMKAGERCLGLILYPLTFPSLQHLELRGWPIVDSSLREFLSKHTSTLRELSLLQCAISENPTNFAQWARNHMFLSGVRIDVRAVSDDKGDDEGWREWDSATLEHLWLAGRPNSLRVQS